MPWGPSRWLAVALLLPGGLSTVAQLSPGPLSRAHQELDSTRGCFECHGRGDEPLSSRCLDCHGAIAQLIQAGRGLHGKEADRGCARCHPEHVGRDFDLIAWEEGSSRLFQHERSGWPLSGKHAALECRACHAADRQDPLLLARMKNRHPEQSWLGLEASCTACHADPHRGELDNDCLRCHGQQAWKPASAFDHQATDFTLVGRHRELKCDDCHLAARGPMKFNAAGERVPLYKPLPHDQCSTCHEDVHRGRLGADCNRCHVEQGFRQVERENFDHSRTRYPLQGAHLKVSCVKCHDRQKAWGPRPAFDSCRRCHADPHAGRASLGGQVVDCSRCHSVVAFVPATFTVEEHQRSSWPLDGKHAEVECAACHQRRRSADDRRRLGPAGVMIRPPHERCRDCHQDAHGGQLEGGARSAGDCADCHDARGFAPSTLTRDDHRRLDFDLEGSHAVAECRACHDPRRHRFLAPMISGSLGSAGLALALGPRSCTACHVDPHQGGFEARRKCLDCHQATSFGRSRIDLSSHAQLGFALDGAHRALPCVDCHRELKGGPVAGPALLDGTEPVRRLLFGERRSRCEDCHVDPHGGQFDSRERGSACDRCHSVQAFRPADRFDHESDSRFRLAGAHRGVECSKCHRPAIDGQGKPYVVYRPLPSTCRDCHGARQAGEKP
ncbi:MAG TPA: hypothetical protein ENK10_00835 [Acidobacteria bacterium]|nr:hypothetical protein [Acidobacteriota bacterium]